MLAGIPDAIMLYNLNNKKQNEFQRKKDLRRATKATLETCNSKFYAKGYWNTELTSATKSFLILFIKLETFLGI